MSYCAYCGNEIPKSGVCDCEEAVAERNKGTNTPEEEYTPEKNADYGAMFQKHKVPIIAGVLGVILLLVLVGVFSSFSKTDAFDYVSISFDGYNSAGTVSVNFMSYNLICEIIGEEPEVLAEMIEWEEKYELYDEGMSVQYSPLEGLSNGDNITVSISVSGAAANRINGGTKTFVVAGLTEVETVDVFKDISVSYKGISGDGKPVIELEAETEHLEACNLQFDKATDLSNGDKITLTITNPETLAEKYNKVPIELSREYEVSGLGAYATKADQIPKTLLEKLIEQHVKDKSDTEPDFMFSYSPAEFSGAYFMYIKDGVSSSFKNELHIFVRRTTYKDGEHFRTSYSPLVFRNIIVDADGTVTLDYEDGESSSFTTDMENYLSKRSDKFTIEEITGITVGKSAE
ncbi:MAG: hypothetical protein IJC33_06600 [Clostridia bacterium]|nr:hypothetical protein [Clostridia bacterium]